jgi:hypothetical protein
LFGDNLRVPAVPSYTILYFPGLNCDIK